MNLQLSVIKAELDWEMGIEEVKNVSLQVGDFGLQENERHEPDAETNSKTLPLFQLLILL